MRRMVPKTPGHGNLSRGRLGRASEARRRTREGEGRVAVGAPAAGRSGGGTRATTQGQPRAAKTGSLVEATGGSKGGHCERATRDARDCREGQRSAVVPQPPHID